MNRKNIVRIACLLAVIWINAGTRTQAQINALEYFIDADPGIGNATAVNTGFTPGDSVNLQLQVPVGNIDPGFHQLYIRSRNQAGKWGLYSAAWFFTANINATPGIAAAEYFFDTDPGTSNGTALNTGSGDSISSLFSIPVPAGLSGGMHHLHIRAKTYNGVWSHYKTQLFFVTGITNTASQITGLEYFFDTDPGVGHATGLSITATDSLQTQVLIPVPAGLSGGIHHLHIRARANNGTWGHYKTQLFFVTGIANTSSQIDGLEYFFDTDPGIGNGQTIALSPTDSAVHMALIPVGSLSPGLHRLHIRAKNTDDIRSHIRTQLFFVTPAQSGSTGIVAAEYFIDADPGMGSGVPIAINPATDSFSHSWMLALPPSLTSGNHILTMRVRNEQGIWSHFRTDSFAVKMPQPGSGYALQFDGINDFVAAPAPAISGAYTFETWVRFSSAVTAQQNILATSTGNPAASYAYQIKTDVNGRFVHHAHPNGTQTITGTTVADSGRWYHIAITATENDMIRLYVNGVEEGTASAAGTLWNGAVTLFAGHATGGNAGWFKGVSDELRVWNTALSETEIRERMCRKITAADPLYPSLIYHFDYDEGFGQMLYMTQDSTTGAVTGASWVVSGAPIGNTSVYSYTGATASAGLSHPLRGDSIHVALTSGNAAGVHIYCVTDSANHVNGTTCLGNNDGYFGVFPVGDTQVSFDAAYDYSNLSGSGLNESGFLVYRRTTNSGVSWNNAGAGVDTMQNLLSFTDTLRGEYIISNAVVAATIQITTSPGNTICAGTTVTFTATVTNEGSNPVYEWRKNGVTVGNNNQLYTDTSLQHNDVITCMLTSNSACVSPDSALSNSIVMSVNSLVTSVSITADQGNVICAGTQVNFTALPVHGGSTPVFQWKINGVPQGGNAAVFTSHTLNNNDVVSCEMTTSESCATPALAVSNAISMSVTPLVTPVIDIAPDAGTTICAGTLISFTATTAHEGSNPVYQWRKNSVAVGNNSNTYVDNSLADGDVIACELLSNANCASPSAAVSAPVTMEVHSSAPADISITSGSGSTVCSGTSVLFTAVTTNTGYSPVFQWEKNGISTGANSHTYTDNGLLNGDVISCFVTGSNACANPDTARSNQISMTVNGYETPTISITTTQADTVCAGTTVVYTALVANGGSAPTLQWKRNGTNIPGATATTYQFIAPTGQDTIHCVLQSNYACLNTNNVLSNELITHILPIPTADAGADQAIVQGSSITLTAGGGDSYLWNTLDTTASIIVSPTATTTYTVTAFNEHGCSSNDAVTVTVQYSNLSVTPSVYDFGNVVVNDTANTHITITNNGTLHDTVYAITLSGGFYSSFATPALLPPGSSVQIPVQFIPAGILIYQAPMAITTSAGNFSAVIKGRGVAPAPAWTVNPVAYNFDNISVYDSQIHVFQIQNTGNVPIAIDTVISTNPVFDIHATPHIIQKGTTAPLFIKFKPDALTSYSGQITIAPDNAGLGVLTISLTGTGFIPGTAPTLHFDNNVPYNGASGVDYIVAPPGVFNYQVVYKHPAGIAPQAGYPKIGIDRNNDGDFIDVNEGVFSMHQIGTNTDWINGEVFVFSQHLPLGATYGYQFFGRDSLGNDAIQQHTQYIAGPIVTNQVLDLSIYANDINFSITNPAVGQLFTVSAQIHNTSLYNATDVPIRYYMDSLFMVADTIPFIAANSNVTIYRDFSFPVDGFYPIKIWIDSAATLGENNILNNYAIRPVIVGNFTVPGAIHSTTNAATNICGTPSVHISGNASYSGLNLQGTPPALGSTVTVDIQGGPTLTTHTVTNGYWSVNWNYFACGQTYDYTVTVTDYTLTSLPEPGTFIVPCTLCVQPAPPTTTHSGFIPACVSPNTPTAYEISVTTSCNSPQYYLDTTFVYVDGNLMSTYVRDTLFPCQPLEITDTLVFSAGIYQVSFINVFYDSAGISTTLSHSRTVTVAGDPDLYLSYFQTTGPKSFSFRDYNSAYCAPAGAHTIYLYDSTALTGQYVLLDSFQVNGVPHSNYVGLSFNKPDWERGYHYLKLVTDVHQTVAELNENNNELHMLFYVPYPELWINNIIMSNSNIVENDVVNFSASLYNSGSDAGPFRVQFYANHIPFGSPVNVDTLATNTGTTIISGMFTIPADTCPVTISAIADIDNDIPELNKQNNTDSMHIAYDITSGYPCFGYGSACNPYIVVRDSLTRFNSIVSNIGTRDIHGMVHVSFRLGGTTIGYDNILGIPAGSNKPTGLHYTFSATGNYVIQIHPDTSQLICELNEQNNTGSIYVTVVEGMPDLKILSEHISPSNLNPAPGQAISIVASIFNTGNQTSAPAVVRFWVDEVQLGADVPIDSIFAGQDTTVAATVSFSASTVGSKIIKVMADATELVMEIRENNNTATRAVIVGAAPDMAASLGEAITVSAAEIRRLDTVSISNYIRNYGGDGGTAWLRFDVMDENNLSVFTDSVQFSLPANDSVIISVDWPVSFTGNGTIMTDIRHTSPPEFNVLNNTDVLSFVAGPQLKPAGWDTGMLTVCTGDSVQLQAGFLTDGQPLSFAWLHQGAVITGATDTFYTIPVTTHTDSGSYLLMVTDSFGSVETPAKTVSVHLPVTITQQPASMLSVCEGNPLQLEIAATQVSAYQWQANGVNIPGATSAAYTDTNTILTASSDYQVFLTAMPGCSDTLSTIATVMVYPVNSMLASSGTIDSFFHAAGITYNYSDPDCRRLVSVVNGSQTLGLTSVMTTIDTSLTGWVSRYVDINPEYNNLPAMVILYYLQAEFDAYNLWAAANNKPLLPTYPGDTNIQYMYVAQYHGDPASGTTGPGGRYDELNKTIIPAALLTVQWDTTQAYWAVSFAVNGFSGFYLYTDNPVPLALGLKDIHAVNAGAKNRVTWETWEEDAGGYFEVERSMDGQRFEKMNTLAARGRPASYYWWDEQPFSGTNFYRLKIMPATGNHYYSNTVQATVREGGQLLIAAYPNPVNRLLSVTISGLQGEDPVVSVMDLYGRVLETIPVLTKEIAIDMQSYSPGNYLIQYQDSHHSQVIKITRE